VGSNQKRSSRKRPPQRRATAAGSARPASRTGAGAARRSSGGATAAGRPPKPSIAAAKAFAVAPYADRPTPKERRRAQRERQRRLLLVPGAPAVIRGGWPGFLVLFFGEGANILVTGDNAFVLLWIAVIAYAVAGNRAATASPGSAPRAVRDGALAGALAFLITVPLRFIESSGQALITRWWWLLFQLLCAFVIAGLAALIVARARQKVAGRPAGRAG
jgi:hypothetical protein